MQIHAKQSRYRTTSTNVLLIISSALLACICVEIFLRWYGYNPMNWTGDGRSLIIRPSVIQERIYEAIPNANGRVWGADVAINSAGFRDREYSAKKPAGVYRIAVIGDSIAFGNNLPVDDTFSNQLEQLFAGSEQEVEVLNLSLGGYDTLQEVSTLEHAGLQYAPDLVVLSYCFNDIGVSSINLEYINRARQYNSSPIYRLGSVLQGPVRQNQCEVFRRIDR